MQVAIIFPEVPDVKQTMLFKHALGQGKFKVYLIESPDAATRYALKLFSRDFKLREHYEREKLCISKLEHQNIIKHIPIVSHNSRFNILLTEHAPNGDLFDLVNNGFLQSEEIIRTFFHQLIRGLEYIHEQGVAHLDLKLENIMLSKDFELKIIDFDQAQTLSDPVLRSRGTRGYRAPEVGADLSEGFTSIDIFAAGVILYALKYKELPFDDEIPEEIGNSYSYECFKKDRDLFWREKNDKRKHKIEPNEDLEHLISGMLDSNTINRFDIEQIKRSRWYNGPTVHQEELKDSILKLMDGKKNI